MKNAEKVMFLPYLPKARVVYVTIGNTILCKTDSNKKETRPLIL